MKIPKFQLERASYWRSELQKHAFFSVYEFVFDREQQYCLPLLEAVGNPLDFKDLETPHKPRIPVFIGTQFGVIPSSSYQNISSRYVCVISRSALSGALGGLSIYLRTSFPMKPNLGDSVFNLI